MKGSDFLCEGNAGGAYALNTRTTLASWGRDDTASRRKSSVAPCRVASKQESGRACSCSQFDDSAHAAELHFRWVTEDSSSFRLPETLLRTFSSRSLRSFCISGMA